MGQSDRLISVAKSYLGYTESPPNSNKTIFGERYGLNGQPWCVIAIWAWFQEAGLSELFCGGNRAADCGTLRRWYREMGQSVPVSEVQPGDILILNFSGTQTAEHCGIVTEVGIRLSNGTPQFIRTIEGNTSPGLEGSQDNGGCVALKTRFPYQVVGVCRPAYKEEPMEKKDWEGHWAEKAIRRCIEKGLMTGYRDGTFQPDKPVTRAELATVLERLEREA